LRTRIEIEEINAMPTPRRRRLSAHRTSNSVRIRLDEDSKECLTQAARLRGISVGDYVRAVTVPQARRELLAAREQTLAMAPEEQLAFWKALAEPPKLTEAQRRLTSLMRGAK
jgi:uncharacterized protein (DUF1778 family)